MDGDFGHVVSTPVSHRWSAAAEERLLITEPLVSGQVVFILDAKARSGSAVAPRPTA
jgi:hypothetical protein